MSAGRLFLILLTFAVGGSLCGYLGRKLLAMVFDGRGVLWVVVYVLLVTLLWPLCVIVVSIFTGQFNFFRAYLAKMGRRISGQKKADVGHFNIAIFASGTGSNAEQIIGQLPQLVPTKVRKPVFKIIISDNPAAKVLDLAGRNKIPSAVIQLKGLNDAATGDMYRDLLEPLEIDLIILAGYLKKIPAAVVARYPDRIVNIHPALLPAYGGKGMYGANVHRAVIAANESFSGISIHLVDEIYDNGKILLQEKVSVDKTDTPESLAKKVLALEHKYYPQVIAEIINQS